MTYTLTPKVKAITEGAPKQVTDYYVYLWRDMGKVFYVGMGQNRRAWNYHSPELNAMRDYSTSFTVSILRDGLTKAEARTLKDTLQRKYNVS